MRNAGNACLPPHSSTGTPRFNLSARACLAHVESEDLLAIPLLIILEAHSRSGANDRRSSPLVGAYNCLVRRKNLFVPAKFVGNVRCPFVVVIEFVREVQAMGGDRVGVDSS